MITNDVRFWSRNPRMHKPIAGPIQKNIPATGKSPFSPMGLTIQGLAFPLTLKVGSNLSGMLRVVTSTPSVCSNKI